VVVSAEDDDVSCCRNESWTARRRLADCRDVSGSGGCNTDEIFLRTAAEAEMRGACVGFIVSLVGSLVFYVGDGGAKRVEWWVPMVPLN